MVHPAIDLVRQVLPPPSAGGDLIDWEGLARSTGWEFPADYKDFVEIYGGGEIDEYLSVETPPVEGSPYGRLLEGADPALPSDCRAELAPGLPPGEELRLLPFGATATGDVVFWLVEELPEKWRVAIFRRQSPYGMKRWSIFDGGMADFLHALLAGSLEPFSQDFSDGQPHTYVSWRDA
ncbi:SMI1/KNR4 family protein [Streptomyces asoensis]|uniref:SMI1/KNR4 family protein n=1 Tax=Streptomyces asoensis TaxID=249586 RepID=UPI0033CE8A69